MVDGDVQAAAAATVAEMLAIFDAAGREDARVARGANPTPS